jgi:hypothetical protein
VGVAPKKSTLLHEMEVCGQGSMLWNPSQSAKLSLSIHVPFFVGLIFLTMLLSRPCQSCVMEMSSSVATCTHTNITDYCIFTLLYIIYSYEN